MMIKERMFVVDLVFILIFVVVVVVVVVVIVVVVVVVVVVVLYEIYISTELCMCVFFRFFSVFVIFLSLQHR